MVIDAQDKFAAKRAAADKKRGSPSGDRITPEQGEREKRLQALRDKLDRNRGKS